MTLGSGCFRQQQLPARRLSRYANPCDPQTGDHRVALISIPIRSRSLNNEGHNYFLSQNPYALNSYAGFGEAYYNVLSDLKLTGGLRWTEDRKHFIEIPSELSCWLWLCRYRRRQSAMGSVHGPRRRQLDAEARFHRSDMIYGSYAHGYKAGGANPPGAIFPIGLSGARCQITDPIHPLTFKPEFIDAFELGSKNTLLDGALTLNGDVFYYNYENYQISEIVDRTAINRQFRCACKRRGNRIDMGADSRACDSISRAAGKTPRSRKAIKAVDLMDRTAGNLRIGWWSSHSSRRHRIASCRPMSWLPCLTVVGNQTSRMPVTYAYHGASRSGHRTALCAESDVSTQ